jgi:hypothetical protein
MERGCLFKTPAKIIPKLQPGVILGVILKKKQKNNENL